MKDVEQRRRKFASLLDTYPDPPLLKERPCHTRIDGGTVLFVPHLLLTRPNAIALREAARTLEPLLRAQETRIRVDCSDLSCGDALRLWRRSSWSDIRAGFALFASLPCSVGEVRVVSPRAPPPYWGMVVSASAKLLPPKMRSRLLVVDPL